MSRLGKRERTALAAKGQQRLAVITRNMRLDTEIDADRSLRKSRAYNPGAEKLTIYGRCRVIHNAQGSKPVKSLVKQRFSNT